MATSSYRILQSFRYNTHTLYTTHQRRHLCIGSATIRLSILICVMTLSTQGARRKNAIKYDAERAVSWAAANPSEATSTASIVPKRPGRKPKALHHKKEIRLEKEESARVVAESARVAEAARAKLRGHSSHKLVPLPTKPSAPSNHGPTTARPKCPQPPRRGTRSNPTKPVREQNLIDRFIAEPAPPSIDMSNHKSPWQSIQDTNAKMGKSIACLKLERKILRQNNLQKAADIAALNKQ